jgi:hypothetical protein
MYPSINQVTLRAKTKQILALKNARYIFDFVESKGY